MTKVETINELAKKKFFKQYRFNIEVKGFMWRTIYSIEQFNHAEYCRVAAQTGQIPTETLEDKLQLPSKDDALFELLGILKKSTGDLVRRFKGALPKGRRPVSDEFLFEYNDRIFR